MKAPRQPKKELTTVPAPYSETALTVLRSRNLYILLLLFAVCTLFYYLGEIIDFAGWKALRVELFYTVHDIHRLFFLAPIVYAAWCFGIKGAVLATAVCFLIFLPRALGVSPFPNPVLRMTLFTIVAGAVGVLTGVVRNEARRRSQLQALVRSERDKFLGILERMEDAVFIVGPDYRVRFMNPSMVREFGEGIGSYCYAYLHAFDEPCRNMCKLPKILAGASDRWEYTFPDGRTFDVVASPFVDSDGAVCHLATYRNISQRKQVEVELAEVSRLKSDLISNVSHELKSPLTSIKGIISGLLQKDATFDDDTREMLLSSVIEETDRLASLVTNLLDISKLEAGIWKPEKERCYVSDIINDVLERQKWLHKKCSFRTELVSELPEVYADYNQIKQVLINLVENAAAYSEESSSITIVARGVDDEIEVSVSDQGEGIPQEDLSKIFDKFYRGTQKRKKPGGTGLGLAICQAIILNHGGRIWAESEMGHGSTLYFRLPAARPGDTGAK